MLIIGLRMVPAVAEKPNLQSLKIKGQIVFQEIRVTGNSTKDTIRL